MKVGDRIRVFEIKDHDYNVGDKLTNLQRPEIDKVISDKKEYSNQLLVSDIKGLGFNAWFRRTRIKQVATMVIKSIKS